MFDILSRFRLLRRRAARIHAPRRPICEPLEDRRLLAAAPIISEFMADNADTLVDASGARRDWIEIYNAGDAAVDLHGWHLTDNPSDLTRWTFPSANLEPGAFLVVFASGCQSPGVDCPTPGIELHANFQLDAAGEYVALVMPDGATVASSYGVGGNNYPKQFEDTSYGVSQGVQTASLVPSRASARVLVPQDDSLGVSWTAPSFVPGAAWTTGTTGVGYDVGAGGTPVPGGTAILSLDFNDVASTDGAADTQAGFTGMTIAQNGSTFGGVTVSLSALGGATLDDRDRATPVNSATLTQAQVYDDFIFANGTFDGAEMQVRLRGLAPGTTYRVTLWSFDSGSPGARVSNWTEIASGAPVVIAQNYTFDGSQPPSSNYDDTMSANLVASPTGELILRGVRNGGTSHGVFLNALQVVLPGIDEIVETDIASQMYQHNASVFTRIEFAAPNAADYDLLSLRMKYDAGFVAYLNGQEVARRNAPTAPGVPPAFNAAATAERTVAETLVYEEINISAYRHLLNSAGLNVLAIHGLNSSAADGDFVLLPELIATEIGGGDINYFDTPTPGAANGTGYFGFVEDTTFDHDRGFYDAPFDVAIATPTDGAIIYYTLDGSLPSATNPAAFVYTQPVHINTTTTLRAMATLPGFRPTDVDTQTYIFLDHVIRQAEVGVEYVEISDANTVGTLSGLADWHIPTINGASSTLWVPRQATAPATPYGTFITAWQSAAAVTAEGVPMITVTMSGLTPGADYNVFASFWDADSANVWTVRAGLSPGSVAPFTSVNSYFTGRSSGDRLLYNGFVGVAAADAAGTIRVYLDDVAPNTGATRTFLDSVGYSQGELPTFVPRSYPAVWQGASNNTADFEMDPQVVAQWDDHNPANADVGIRQSLQSIPTMSIVMNPTDLWDKTNGIYPNATSVGAAWERPGSIEYFDPATGDQFQYNVGVQMHGGSSRDNVRLKKHPFRLIFSGDFGGPNELKFPLFGPDASANINTVVMRAFSTDSFAMRTVTDRYSPLDSLYLRDVWMRDTQLAMGQPSAHSTYVHLYINGLYWGLYNPSERPDDAFAEEYLGGDRDEYDVIKDFNEVFRGEIAAWNAMFNLANQLTGPNPDAVYQQLQGKNPDGTYNPALPRLLDMDNFIDYMALHLYAGPEDWPHHNWYAARRRTGETNGFQFYTWDQEIVLDGRFRDRTDAANAGSPSELLIELRNSPAFRLQFADRVQKHFFNDGAMTLDANITRWLDLAGHIESAIVAESARWGDAREGESVVVSTGDAPVIIPTLTVDHWRVERDRVAFDFFPQSQSLFLERLLADGLYPAVSAPQLSQHGGTVPADYSLTMSNPNAPSGVIYFTIDGSDPRNLAGNPAATATIYAGPATLSSSLLVKARVLAGGQWSALTEAFFTVRSPLRVSEVHYHPADPTASEIAAGFIDADEFEFIEVVNASATATVDLEGTRFTNGVEFTFGDVQLAPGARAVVVRNAAAFNERYGVVANVVGQYGGTPDDFRLSNAGERITLVDNAGGEIQSFSYDDAWYPTTDGTGPSLVVADEQAPTANWDLAAGWKPSLASGGSPGQADSLPGDFNADLRVDLFDLAILQSHLGVASGATVVDGDMTGDGAVDRADAAMFARQFGRSASLTPASPAAAAAVLARAANVEAVRRDAAPRGALAALRRRPTPNHVAADVVLSRVAIDELNLEPASPLRATRAVRRS